MGSHEEKIKLMELAAKMNCNYLEEPDPANAQFREDVRACLKYLIGDPDAAARHWSAVIACAIEGAEELEKQLKERGRI